MTDTKLVLGATDDDIACLEFLFDHSRSRDELHRDRGGLSREERARVP